MNWEQVEGKWEQLKGQVREKWGKLTHDDVAVIQGKREKLLGKLQERYGYNAAQAERELGDFVKNCDCATDEALSGKHQPHA